MTKLVSVGTSHTVSFLRVRVHWVPSLLCVVLLASHTCQDSRSPPASLGDFRLSPHPAILSCFHNRGTQRMDQLFQVSLSCSIP